MFPGARVEKEKEKKHARNTRRNSVQTNLGQHDLSPKKRINKSFGWHPEGTRGVPMEGAPPGANQIDLFMHFLGDKSCWPRLVWTEFLLVEGRK